MRRLVLLPMVWPLLGCASGMAVPPANVHSPADEAAIRSLEEAERLGVLNQDYQVLEEIWSESFIVNSPLNQIAPNRAVVLGIFRQGLAHLFFVRAKSRGDPVPR